MPIMRHCEELLRRSNPVLSCGLLDCFASLAMTGLMSPNAHHASLRGALATKQSSSFLWPSGLLRFARNDGVDVAECPSCVIARSSCDEAIQFFLVAFWIASLRSQ